MGNVIDLTDRRSRTPENILLIAAGFDHLTGGLLDGSPSVTVVWEDAAREGYTRAAAVAVVVSWTLYTRTRGDRPRALTIVQTDIGGLDGGEGWYRIEQYVSDGALTADEARTIAHLAASGMLPVLAHREES